MLLFINFLLIILCQFVACQLDASVVSFLNAGRSVASDITGTINGWNNIRYDGGTDAFQIDDGGSGIFRGGNRIQFLVDGVNPLETEPSTYLTYNNIYKHQQYEFGTSASQPFLALMWIKNENRSLQNFTIKVSGGIRNSKTRETRTGSHRLELNNGLTANSYVIHVFGGGAPSISEVFFHIQNPTSWNSISPPTSPQTFPHFPSKATPEMSSIWTITKSPRYVVMGYMLLSRTTDQAVSTSEYNSVIKKLGDAIGKVLPNKCTDQDLDAVSDRSKAVSFSSSSSKTSCLKNIYAPPGYFVSFRSSYFANSVSKVLVYRKNKLIESSNTAKYVYIDAFIKDLNTTFIKTTPSSFRYPDVILPYYKSLQGQSSLGLTYIASYDPIQDILQGIYSVSTNITRTIPGWLDYKYNPVAPTEIEEGSGWFTNEVIIYRGQGSNSLPLEYNKIYRNTFYDAGSSAGHPFAAIGWIKKHSPKLSKYSIEVIDDHALSGGRRREVSKTQTIRKNGYILNYATDQMYGGSKPSVCKVFFDISSKPWWKSIPGRFEHTRSGNQGQAWSDSQLHVEQSPENVAIGYLLLMRRNGRLISNNTVENSLYLMIDGIQSKLSKYCYPPPNITHGDYSPKQELYKVGEVITYSCGTGYRIDGFDTVTCLSGDRYNNLEATCVRVCPSPPILRNGEFTSAAGPYDIGSVIKYTCRQGYHISGIDSITCQNGGQFSSLRATCIKTCPFPPSLLNGNFTIPSNKPFIVVDTIITYRCNEGYKLNGSNTIICQDAGYTQLSARCVEVCSSPPKLANGNLTQSVGSYEVGSIVRYTCNKGYRLSGSHTVTCQSGGRYSLLSATCIEVCPPPSRLSNGEFHPSVGPYDVGSSVNYTCKKGYRMSGRSQVVCQNGGKYSRMEGTCMKVCLSPIPLLNGHFTPSTGPYDVGSVITYSCKTGYKLSGQERATCLNSGEFSSVIALCVEVCPPPSHLSNGEFHPSVGPYDVGSSVNYTCKKGYRMSGRSQVVCQNGGKYSKMEGTCMKVCLSPIPLLNGHFTPSTGPYDVGSVITYSCKTGYKLSGQERATCLNSGEFSSVIALCVEVCSSPPSLANGTFTPPNGPYDVGSEVKYECDKGYRLSGKNTMNCEFGGTFSELTASCIQICSSPPSLSNGYFAPSKGPYDVGSRVTYSCKKGYRMSGNNTIRCMNGSYNTLQATCIEVCPSPPSLQNGKFKPHGGPFDIGTVITYSCNGGYRLSGNSLSTCQSGGKYSRLEATCIETCPPPSNLTNGEFTPSTGPYDVGNWVIYKCNKGFRLEGRRILKCQKGRTYFPSKPICVEVCSNPPLLTNGNYTPYYGPFDVHTTISYECKEGYKMSGSSTVTCQVGGKYTNFTGICDQVCAEPPSLKNGSFAPPSGPYYVGSVIRYSCIEGYKLIGNTTISCQMKGIYSKMNATCVKDRKRESPCVPCLNCLRQNKSCIPKNQDKAAAAITKLTSPNRTLSPTNIATATEYLTKLSKDIKNKTVPVSTVKDYLDSVDNLVIHVDRYANVSSHTDAKIKATETKSTLLTGLNNIATRIKLPSNNEVKTISSDKISLQVVQIGRLRERREVDASGYSDVNFNLTSTSKEKKKDISVTIPGEAIESVAQESNNENLLFYATLVKDGNFLDPEANTSQIVSVGGRGVTLFSHPVSISFESIEIPERVTPTSNKFKVKLSQINLGKFNPKTSSWERSDCSQSHKNTTFPQYNCRGPNSYAVLFSSIVVPSNVYLTVVSYIGCVISIICLVLTVFLYVTFKALRQKPTTHPLVNICLSLIGVYLFYAVGVSQSEYSIVCNVMTAMLQFVSLASWGWMCVNAFEMYSAFSKIFHKTNKTKLAMMYTFAYGIPLIIVILNTTLTLAYVDGSANQEDITFVSAYRERNVCWLRANSLYYGFVVPVAMAFTFNLVLFILLIRILTCQNEEIRSTAKKRTTQDHLIMSIALITMMGLTWIFGFLLLFSDNIAYQSAMQWLFTLSNVFQGILIFYLNCLRRKDVRKIWVPRKFSEALASIKDFSNTPHTEKSSEMTTFQSKGPTKA